MIFLCGNCQAKYQLPDERVAGRTVRMKCRKCDHLIEAKGPSLEALAAEKGAAPAEHDGGEPASSAPPSGWYVGIGGNPTGPLSEEEIASKLDAGVMTNDSLVWREGLEGWKPLSTIDELKSLIAAQPEPEPEPAPPPPTPPAPPSAPRVVPVAQAAPRPSIAGIPRPPPARPSAPRTSLSPAISSRLSAAAPKLEEEPAFTREAAAPAPEPTPVVLAAVPATEPTSEPEPLAPLAVEPAKVENESSTMQEAGAAAAPSLERSESLVIPIAAPRRRVHPAAWAFVGLGGVLVGIFAGLSLAEKPKPEVQIVTVSVPVEAPPAPAATVEAPSEPEEAANADETEAAEAPAEPSKAPKVAAAATNEARPRAATTTTGSKSSGQAAPAMTGLSSLSGLGTGPAPGPGKSSSTGGGGALSQAEVERVVQSHRAFVKRRCWELALATKSQGAPSSARVMTTITIAPDGRVTSANATGGDGYPGLSSCVAGQVRGWRFPPSEGGTVNVPFVFAAQ